MIYIDLNPNRANMVTHPKEFRWSSFHYYGHGKEDPLITPAPSYLRLGKTNKERQKAYLAMIEEILKDDWKKKKPYSSSPFIGNPDWVKKKIDQLKEFRRIRYKNWKKRFRLKFSSVSP